jgi:hypothetical protein
MMLHTVAPSASAAVIPLDSRRPQHRRTHRRLVTAAAVFAVCLLGLIGSFADSAVARTGLLLIGSDDDLGSNLDGIATTLIWATVANIAACAGVAIIVYWFLSRPTAQVVELRPRRRKR